MDVIYRFDPDRDPPVQPGTAREAAERLQRGNEQFVQMSAPSGGGEEERIIDFPPICFDAWLPPDEVPAHTPFAAVLGCSDARVPTEIIFNQPRNDLFVVRVAGNVLGSECLGSIEYAANNLTDSLRLVVVLGHCSCGAVTAAVDAFLDPARYPDIASSHALRAVIDRIFISVRAASETLLARWGPNVVQWEGYRTALIEMSAAFSAALTSWTLRSELPQRILDHVDVVFGVFDMLTREVWSPSVEGAPQVVQGLAPAPSDPQSFHALQRGFGESERVRKLLGV